jgi:choline-sulfatase
MDWVPAQDPEGRFVRGGHARSDVPPRVGVTTWTKFLTFDEGTHFRALEYVRERAREPGDEPFFFVASYHHPHDPFLVTQELWDRYDGAEIELPERAIRTTPRWTAGRTMRTRRMPSTSTTRRI